MVPLTETLRQLVSSGERGLKLLGLGCDRQLGGKPERIANRLSQAQRDGLPELERRNAQTAVLGCCIVLQLPADIIPIADLALAGMTGDQRLARFIE